MSLSARRPFPSLPRRTYRALRAAASRGESWLNHRRLRHFVGRHAGERCFIIGNGPSLLVEDLERLRHEITFAANKIYLLFDHTSWRPTYYVAEDDHFLEQHHRELIRWSGYVKFVNGAWRHLFRGHREVIWYPWRPPDERGFPRFSTRASEPLHCGYMVTYISLQLAYWMGFSRVYLLGVDFNYQVDFKGKSTIAHATDHPRDHFSAAYFRPGEHRYAPRLDLAETAMRRARGAYCEAGREVWNATRGGALEVFPRASLDEVLAKART